MSLLQVVNLVVGYSFPLSSEINFSLDRGDILLIKGRNGSGKSTLIKTILSLIKAKSGSVLYSEELKTRGIAYLSQENLLDKHFPITVEEMLISALAIRHKSFCFFSGKNRLRSQLTNLAEKLELGELLKHNFGDLSVGQKQRVLFARALAIEADLLILDELTASVDSVSRDFIRKILWKIKEEKRLAMIIVSHDADFDLTLPNKFLYLNEDGSNKLECKCESLSKCKFESYSENDSECLSYSESEDQLECLETCLEFSQEVKRAECIKNNFLSDAASSSQNFTDQGSIELRSQERRSKEEVSLGQVSLGSFSVAQRSVEKGSAANNSGEQISASHKSVEQGKTSQKLVGQSSSEQSSQKKASGEDIQGEVSKILGSGKIDQSKLAQYQGFKNQEAKICTASIRYKTYEDRAKYKENEPRLKNYKEEGKYQ